MIHNKRLLALALSGLVGIAQAGEKEELLKLRNTTTNLIKQLVKQGVITENAAEQMIKQAEADAETQVAVGKAAAATREAVPADEVRVAYVPDFVKDEIRQQVRSELREEVVGDVMAKAKNEQWGLPNALPEWTKRFKLSGDLRLREQMEFNAADNALRGYQNYQAINDRGGTTAAAANSEQFLNTTKDRNRMRERFRLGIDVNIADGVDAGVRLATGNIRNPTSTNQTLGNYGDRYEFRVDRAYLKYDALDDNKFNWLTLTGGRIANPFYTGGSELVWDEDLSFEGVAGTVRHRFGASSGSLDEIGAAGPTIFATAGAFPLQESGLSTHDKWLFGGQTGLDWEFSNQDNLTMGVAYYDYRNIQARPNTNQAGNFQCNLNNADNTFSKPDYMQLGNTLTTICNESGSTPFLGAAGLAGDYNILNINAAYDTALFAPVHVRLSADYAKNIGFNLNDMQRRYRDLLPFGGVLNGTTLKAQTTAWQVRADVGWTNVALPGNWSVFTAYKYLQRDAVLDAFTDSDFHLGMTNVKGWMIGGNYGLMKNVWLTGRWLSGDIITGPRYGLDIVQIDINTRF
ncbi:MAG: putative porin [Methylomonas sp.]|jgi:hypothetical protein|uniref:putative porin n=1 Tax=Methylomonas sp. TaxID=418 RepID=UPI0025E2C269|nr:putative porin [Methylomonas sp.]MCK9606087.1 putative porin [Methylomonas sp.]